jgi:hypothetical protein
MKRSKLILVLLILAGTTVAWTIRYGQLWQTRRAIAEAEAQTTAADERLRTAQEELAKAQSRLAAETQGYRKALAEAAQAARELAKRDPESLWAVPPDVLPEWNAESPFVWLCKEIIPQLPVAAFLASGELRPEIACVFTLDSKQQTVLNTALKQCLDGYRKIEAARVERLEEHLPGIADQNGEKLTIRVTPLPEDGAKAKREFEAALRSTLGDQRTDLLLEVGGGWLSSEFSEAGTETKTISVIRHPGGSLGISIKSGGSCFSTVVNKERLAMFKDYIPPHLLPFFREFLEPQGEPGVPAAQP